MTPNEIEIWNEAWAEARAWGWAVACQECADDVWDSLDDEARDAARIDYMKYKKEVSNGR